MESAAKLLVVGGLANLAYGYVTGLFAAKIRAGAPEVSKYLMLAHTGPLIMGPTLLALVLALPLCTLPPTWRLAAAGLLVGGSAVQALGNTVHWLRGVKDEFVEKGPGFAMASAAAGVLVAGLGVLLVGVFRG